MTFSRRVALGTCLVISTVVMIVTRPTAQERPQTWTYETCYTNSCIKKTLEGLTPDRQHDAKLTTWQDTTYV